MILQTSSSSNVFDQHYEIINVVGRGRNSVVYQARRLQAPFDVVALKLLLGAPKQRFSNLKRMRREALAMLACRHPNIVRLNDYVATSELCYLSMEYCERGDLRETLDQRAEPLSLQEAFSIAIQVLRGLEAIHRAGVIHRDIKPENLLLLGENEIKIADFGVALLPLREVSADDSAFGIGTFDYLAPETLRDGIADERSDLYSVAVTLFQLLTKHLPFEGRSMSEQIEQKMHGLGSSLKDRLPLAVPNLDLLLQKSLSNEGSQRFQTAEEFRLALEDFLDESWKPEKTKVLRELPKAPEFGSDADEDDISLKASSELFDIADEDSLLLPVDEVAEGATAEEVEDNRFQRLFNQHQGQHAEPGEVRYVQSPRARLNLGKLVGVLAIGAISAILIISLQVGNSLSGSSPSEDLVASSAPATSVQEAPVVLAPPAEQRAMLSNDPGAPMGLFGAERSGVLDHLFADGSEVSLVTTPTGENKFLVVLALIGWTPIEVNANDISKGGEFTLSGSGMQLVLRVDDSNGVGEHVVGGTYKELNSGREGQWRLY